MNTVADARQEPAPILALQRKVKAELKSAAYFAMKLLSRSRVLGNLRWIKQQQYLPFEQLRKERDLLLQRLARHAATDVPFYAERLGPIQASGLTTDTIGSLPLLTRYELINRREELTNQAASRERVRFVQTGGTTGVAAKLAQDAWYRDWSQASTMLFNSWAGLNLGMPYFFLWGAGRDLDPQHSLFLERLNLGYLQQRRILDASRLHPELALEHLTRIRKETDAEFLIGYANEVYDLACYSRDAGMPVGRRFRSVITTAENLTEPMRKVSEEVFGCKVFNRYGSRDLGDVAQECPYQTGLHINPLYSYVEVVDDDGRPLPPGVPGQLAVTSLHNLAMPLIRYLVGDTGVLQAARRCACGREWETIIQLTGRASEVIYLKDGGRIRTAMLERIFEALPRLQRYQIHQCGYDELRILLRANVPNYVQTHAELLERVRSQLRACTSPRMRIEFVERQAFHRTPTGKELTVVHLFDGAARLRPLR